MSSVPLGVMLSGGIDSSVVAGLMARHSGTRIKTFTLGFLGAKGALQGYDESENARRTAEFLGSEHHELLATAGLVRDTIPEALDHCDEPFATSSVIPTFLVSKLARENVTVALSGDRAYLLEPLAGVYMRVPRLLRKGLFEPALLNLPASDASPLARNIRRTQRFVRAHSYEDVPWRAAQETGLLMLPGALASASTARSNCCRTSPILRPRGVAVTIILKSIGLP